MSIFSILRLVEITTSRLLLSSDWMLRLEAWEEVIVCYTLLELRHKAAEIIKERLKEKETSR